MIYLLKKYWKYLVLFLGVVLVFTGSYVYYQNSYVVSSKNVNKMDKVITEKEEDISDRKTVFVDVKGAVNAPGVYELDNEKRIIDAINLAGGLTSNANVINLNLSKKVKDEMYIIVYTKEEIDYYVKNNSIREEIKCASKECICPDLSNNACIKEDVKENKKETINKPNDKVSINNASKEELMNLSGIGEAKADAIIKYRSENGTFKALEDIKNVSGIGDAVYEKIKDKITL